MSHDFGCFFTNSYVIVWRRPAAHSLWLFPSGRNNATPGKRERRFCAASTTALSKQTCMSALPYRLRAREQRCNRLGTDRPWPMTIILENRKRSKSFYYSWRPMLLVYAYKKKNPQNLNAWSHENCTVNCMTDFISVLCLTSYRTDCVS